MWKPCTSANRPPKLIRHIPHCCDCRSWKRFASSPVRTGGAALVFLPFAWGPLSKRDLGSWLLEATSELRRRAAQRPSSPVARKLADFIGGRFADIAAH